MSTHDHDPELQALVATARGGNSPTAADRARVRRALAVQLGAGALATTAAATSAQAATVGGVALGTALKIGAAVVLAGAMVTGVVAVRRTAPAHANASAARAPRPASPAVPSPEERAAPAPPVAPTIPAAVPAPPAAWPAVRTVRAPASTLADETALIERVHRALGEHRAGDALTMLDGFSWRVPGGALREERAALHVRALCGLGQTDEARAEEARFLRAYPDSPHEAAMRAACRTGAQDE